MIIDILVLFVVSFGLLAVFLWKWEWRFIFYPSPYPEGYWNPPELGSKIQEVTFDAPDGLKLNGWWAPGNETDRTLLWMHGNSGNITFRLQDLNLYMEMGLQVLLFDYRGYGKSEGTPSEEGLYQDAEAALSFLTEEIGVQEQDVILLGRSLGGAIATHLALQSDPGGLLLQSPFTSIRDMTGNALPVPGVPQLMTIGLDSTERIQDVSTPVFIIHGSEDGVVPIQFGRRLYELAEEPKWFLEIEGAGHDYLSNVGGDTYRTAVKRFVLEGDPKIDDQGNMDSCSGPGRE